MNEKNKKKTDMTLPDKIWLFECRNGQLHRTEYRVTNYKLFGWEYTLEDANGNIASCDSRWLEVPRAASLWTKCPDRDKAYQKLLASAQKDMQEAKERLKVYAGILDKVLDANIASTPGNTAVSAPIMKDRFRILVMGRTQTGKTAMAKILSERTGLPILKTSTTRPKRTPDEDTYHFYSEDEATQIPDSEKLFLTYSVDGHARWTGKSDFLNAGIAILDPTAVKEAISLWHEAGSHVAIIVLSSDMATRWSRFQKSVRKNYHEAIQDFCKREEKENPMFTGFELDILKAAMAKTPPYDADKLEVIDNDGKRDLNDVAERILSYIGYTMPQCAKKEIALNRSEYEPSDWNMLCRSLQVHGIDPKDVSRIRIVNPNISITAHGKEL